MIGLSLLFVIMPLTVFTAFLISRSSAKPWVPAPPSRIWMGLRTAIQTIRSLVWCVTAPAGIMAIFIILGGGQFEPAIFRSQRQVSPIAVEVVRDAKASTGSLALAPTPASAEIRPGWLLDQDKTNGDVRRVVLSSQLWSTESEAVQELQAKAAALIRSDFAERHQGPFNSAGQFFMSDEELAKIAVKQRFVEHQEQDFGKFSSPMNRLWWQVEISPLVRTEIYPSWKAGVIRQRVFALGTVLALLTLAANVVGLATTFTRPNGSMAA